MSILPDDYKPEVHLRKSGVPPGMVTKLDVQIRLEKMAAMVEDIRIEKTRPIEDYLTNKTPMQSDKLKVRLIKEGKLPKKCNICGRSKWRGKEISLELDHKNSDHGDNRLANLQLICPNCHATTDGYRKKKPGAKSARDLFGE
tara:strand:+ start:2964 stop:3392 length:429 start_codon:yes stop_codon:yes gene_type:complete